MLKDNINIDYEKYTSEFIDQAQSQLNEMLNDIKEEYRPTAEQVANEMVETYKKISELSPGEEQERLKNNLAHLKASLEHFEASIQIKLYDRIIKICEVAADIAIKAAISALIAL
jgi:hypothetical protein